MGRAPKGGGYAAPATTLRGSGERTPRADCSFRRVLAAHRTAACPRRGGASARRLRALPPAVVGRHVGRAGRGTSRRVRMNARVCHGCGTESRQTSSRCPTCAQRKQAGRRAAMRRLRSTLGYHPGDAFPRRPNVSGPRESVALVTRVASTGPGSGRAWSSCAAMSCIARSAGSRSRSTPSAS